MELKTEQFNKFVQLHEECEGFEKYSDEQKRKIANGIANYYITLFNIKMRIKKEIIINEKKC